MQGKIIVSTEQGDSAFPYNQENHSSLIAQLSVQNIPITKLVFEKIDAQPSELAELFNALKNNRIVTDIKFDQCHIQNDYLKNMIAALVDLPIDTLTKTNQAQESNIASQINTVKQPDPRIIINALMHTRNYTLKHVSIDEDEINHMGLEVNKSLASWHPVNSSIYDLYRFVASYYLSLATQLYSQKQFANAFNYAIYGHLMLKQVPLVSQNTVDQQTAVKFTILLGDLYAKKDMRELSEKRYSEADAIELKIPERERTDENWRNLLVINSSIAKLTDINESPIHTSHTFHRVISALSSFCRIKAKTLTDYNRAVDAAKLISNTGSATAAFIYYVIFEPANTQYNIKNSINDAKIELRQSKFEKMRDLFIELLIFTLKEESSKVFSNQQMKEYLKIPTNKQILEKALVDLTILDKCSGPASQDYPAPEETPKIKKTVASYYASFFESKTKPDEHLQSQPDDSVSFHYA